MAGNNSIQILRGNNVKTNTTIKNQTLLDGQPLYDRSTGYLFVGEGNTIANTTAVNAHYANSAGTASSAIIANTRRILYFNGNGTNVGWNGSSSDTIYVPTSVGSSGQVWGMRSNGTVGWIAQTEIPGTIDHANSANTANYANSAGNSNSANYANTADTANTANKVSNSLRFNGAHANGIAYDVAWNGTAPNTIYVPTAIGNSGQVWGMKNSTHAGWIDQEEIPGTVENANHANTADVAYEVSGSNVTGTVENANYANFAGVAYNVSIRDVATALGLNATANGNNTTALGHNAKAINTYATALGHNANASGQTATAIGAGAEASSDITTAIGSGATASGSGATALGRMATASGQTATAIGQGAKASGMDATALGGSAKAINTYATALGQGATASGLEATALGNGATASSNYSTALGGSATADGQYSTALGGSAKAINTYATALGQGAVASGSGATALGYAASATTDNTIVLGSSSIKYLKCQVKTITELSDSRVKEDVALANTAQCLVDVNRLPVSRFKYKDFTGTHIDVHRTGFMADDVEKVFPKAVAKFDETFPVLDEEGNKVYEQEVDEKGNPVYEQAVDENGAALFNEDGSIKYDETKPVMKESTFVMEDVKSIAMEMAIPTLWGAVQELTKRVESLEAELSLRQ